jgi:membrane protease YdiL (CAAX protease family)
MDVAVKQPEPFVMRRPVWAIIFLLVGAHAYTKFWAFHERGLATQKNVPAVFESALHGALFYSLFLLLLDVIVIFVISPIAWNEMSDINRNGAPQGRWKRTAGTLLAAGIVLIASLALFWRGVKFYTLADLVPFPSSHLEAFFAIFILFIVIPIASELVFRGILFRQLIGSTGVVAASAVSALLYAYVWPFPAIVASALLGIATSIVYYRSRSILTAILTNVAFTVGATLAIEWLRMR